MNKTEDRNPDPRHLPRASWPPVPPSPSRPIPASAPAPRAAPAREAKAWAAGAGTTAVTAPPARLERMAWRLNLTPEQKAKLEPILRQRDEMRTAQRQAMRQEIAGILTPEQLAQFEQMGPGRGGRMGRGMGPGMGPAARAGTPRRRVASLSSYAGRGIRPVRTSSIPPRDEATCEGASRPEAAPTGVHFRATFAPGPALGFQCGLSRHPSRPP